MNTSNHHRHQQLYEVTLPEMGLPVTKPVVEAMAGVLVPRKRWAEAERVVNGCVRLLVYIMCVCVNCRRVCVCVCEHEFTRPITNTPNPCTHRLPADPKAPSPNRGEGAMALLKACQAYGPSFVSSFSMLPRACALGKNRIERSGKQNQHGTNHQQPPTTQQTNQ